MTTRNDTLRRRAARYPFVPDGFDIVAAIARLYGIDTIKSASVVHKLGRTQCMRILILTGYMERNT